MNLRKILAVLISAVMVLSMIPAVTLTASAAAEGDWDTFRNGEEYTPAHEEDGYRPAPGYMYSEEGFHTISADHTNTSPYYNVITKDKQSVKDGIYVEMRVDEYAYEADHWIGFAIWSSTEIAPANTNYGSGWLGMARMPGNGGEGRLDNSITLKKSENDAGYFKSLTGTNIVPNVDDDGKEHYTMEVVWDGANYNIYICGVLVPDGAAITSLLQELDANGDFHIGLVMYSTKQASVANMTILKFGANKADAITPMGTDKKDPEPNINIIAEIEDPSTVEANKPALLYDATLYNAPVGANYEATALGDNAFRIVATAGNINCIWNIKKNLSYDAKDFPVIAIMLRSYDSSGGICYYSAGDTLSADADHMISWGLWDGGSIEYETEEEFYNMTLIDLTDAWEGRVNSIRFDFNELDVSEADSATFDICWAGVFRSAEEAQAYTEAWALENGVIEEGASDSVGSESADSEPADSTPAESQPAESDPVGSSQESVSEAATSENNAAQSEASSTDEKSGCGATLFGSAAVLLSAAAALVALKKKD